MTNVRNKPVDIKRARRQRYKNACKPIIEMFHCTAMQVAGHVRNVIAENANLRQHVEERQEKIRLLKEELKQVKQEMDNAEVEIRLLKEELKQAKNQQTE